jgi:hypothetical protein
MMRQIELPEDLCRRVEQLYAHQFSGLEACLRFVLENLANDQSAALDVAEERLVKQRLHDLGYV